MNPVGRRRFSFLPSIMKGRHEHDTYYFKDRQLDDQTSQSSRKSAASLRSRHATFDGSGRGSIALIGRWLKLREYLLILIEASLSLTVSAIMTKNRTKQTGSDQELDIYTLYTEGYSTLLSLFIGVIADSWLRHYTVALFSVILHFVTITVVVMEDIIIINRKNCPYSHIVKNICIGALVLVRSSDFIRLVYGLEGMADRKKSTIYIYIFLQFWVCKYATHGGFFLNFGYVIVKYSSIDMVTVSFILSGLSVFLFFYVLHPGTSSKDKGLGCEVISCLLLATYYKIFHITRGGKRGFFNRTEGKCKKTTVSRTKEILYVYVLLLPAFGVAFFISFRAHLIFWNIFDRVKKDYEGNQILRVFGMPQLARAAISTGMLLSNFVIWPLLTLTTIEDKHSNKFIFGQFLTVLFFLYGAVLMAETESLQYDTGGGYVWIYNTRLKPVRFLSEDRHFTNFDFDVRSKEGEMVGYICSRLTLFPMTVIFNGSGTNFTTFLSVTPLQTTGFIVLDPPAVLRIHGYIPLQESRSGLSDHKPRIFIYNTVKTLDTAEISIKLAHKKKILEQLVIGQGVLMTIALEPGQYDFSIIRADIRQIVNIEGGALYGMMLYATATTREMEVYTLIGPSTASMWPPLFMCFVLGMARGLSAPALQAMVFSIAPRGLMAMSFAFLKSLEGLGMWFTYIGYRTWHPYIHSSIVFIYASILCCFFFISAFFAIKFAANYD